MRGEHKRRLSAPSGKRVQGTRYKVQGTRYTIGASLVVHRAPLYRAPNKLSEL
ncbi:MAG: hypothetical protein LBN71_07360 [Tannerella sp.]|nr:hypothetical protein [Tannerella sp.]